MKRIAILNDIHGNYLLLERVLRELKYQNIDNYIIGGDLVTDGFENELVVSTLKDLTSNVIAGNRDVDIANYDGTSWVNNDRYRNMQYAYDELSKDSIEYLKNLSIYKVIEIENKKICFSHGSPYNVRESVKPFMTSLFDRLIDEFNCDIYLFAHTHQEFNTKYKNRWFINSGAINCPSSGKPGSFYGILNIDGDNITYEQKVYEFDYEELKRYYLESNYYKVCPEWTNLILYTLKTGNDNCCPFINGLNYNLSYEDNFKKYMKDKNQEIM